MDSVHVRQQALSVEYRKRLEPFANRHELVDEICARLTAGEPLAQIHRDSKMPTPSVLWDWCKADQAIEDEIARARESGADAIAVDALDISDNLSGDVQRDKLRVDTRLRLLAKWNPKRYGESTQLKHADADGNKLDTTPLIGELLGMLGSGNEQPALLNITPKQREAPAVQEQPAPRAFDNPSYKPRARRIAPSADVDDLV